MFLKFHRGLIKLLPMLRIRSTLKISVKSTRCSMRSVHIDVPPALIVEERGFAIKMDGAQEIRTSAHCLILAISLRSRRNQASAKLIEIAEVIELVTKTRSVKVTVDAHLTRNADLMKA